MMRHYVIFRSPCRIQTPSRPVSCTGGWMQAAELEILSCCVTCSLLCN